MYLEISPRQSGKTHRLLREVIRWSLIHLNKEEPATAIVYCATIGQAQNLFAQLSKIMLPAHVKMYGFQSSNKECEIVFEGTKGFQVNTIRIKGSEPTVENLLYKDLWTVKIRRFFDEFDFIDFPSSFIVHENDYFCTTPKSIRKLKANNLPDLIANDPLIGLWVQNKCKCFTHTSTTFPGDLKKSLEGQDARKELFGTFLEITPEVIKVIYKASLPVEVVKPKAIQTLILSENENYSCTQMIQRADIILRHYPGEGRYFIIKNRYGVASFYISESLIEKFLTNPKGKLDWIIDPCGVEI